MHFSSSTPYVASHSYVYDGAVIKQEPRGDQQVQEPAFFLPYVPYSSPHSLESSLPFVDLTGDAVMGGVANAFTWASTRPHANPHTTHDEQERLQDAYILSSMLNGTPSSDTASSNGTDSPMATSDTREFQVRRHRHQIIPKMPTLPTVMTRVLALKQTAPATPLSSLLAPDSPVTAPRTTPANACSAHGCYELAGMSGRCEKHANIRRCTFPGCTKSAQTNGKCIRHGGGRRCEVEGCPRGAQARGKCKTHGGGVRCKAPGCSRSSQGSGLCRTHGGGKLCDYPGCIKGTQRHGKCSTHGGARRCRVDGCDKVDRGGGFCGRHKTELSMSGKLA